MNPLLSFVLLVGGLRAAQTQGAPDGLVRAPGPADAAVAAGLVGLVGLLALTGVVIACCAVGLAVVLFV